MKKLLIGLLVLLVVVGVGVFMFRAPLLEMAMERLVAEMFVSGDADQFDVGVALGAPLPPLSAMYQGTHVADLSTLMGTKGVVLFAIRSVDW